MKATATGIAMTTGAGETGTTGDTTAETGSGENTSGVSISAESTSGANASTGIETMAEDMIQAVTFTFSTDVRSPRGGAREASGG